MVYATGRTYHDADSHIMELPDFLIEHADPQAGVRMPKIPVPQVGLVANLLDDAAERGGHSADKVAELVGMGDPRTAGPKGYLALGAFNSEERSQARDLLGFHQQLVFATFSAGVAFNEERTIEERHATAAPP